MSETFHLLLGMCLFVIPAFLWQRQENQEVKVIMSYIVNLRTIWPTQHFILKINLNRKIKQANTNIGLLWGYWLDALCRDPQWMSGQQIKPISNTIGPWCIGGSQWAFTKCLVGTSSIYSWQIKSKNKLMKLERVQLKKKHLHFVDLEDGIGNSGFVFLFLFFRPGDTELSLLFI